MSSAKCRLRMKRRVGRGERLGRRRRPMVVRARHVEDAAGLALGDNRLASLEVYALHRVDHNLHLVVTKGLEHKRSLQALLDRRRVCHRWQHQADYIAAGTTDATRLCCGCCILISHKKNSYGLEHLSLVGERLLCI